RWLTYVSKYNLYMLDLAGGQTIPLTRGGGEEFRFATPDTYGDFLQDGYWWSPDSSRVACLVTDERSVQNFPLEELTSMIREILHERFPHPGQPVPAMGVCILSGQTSTWIDAAAWSSFYLARVDWLPDSRRLALQLMSRAQDHLVLLIADSVTGACYQVL